ncbi:hypothetical protein [Myxococcus sp. AM010]|uniref:hypothetical protein n=1 Tax=Myxococcus sp. AM010 TaxID=2745138 RepID=UPI001595893E|nr:hypothetical protein [Myxococcus sp. AM010]NVJ14287.1 hypothetical protein [Myxococcus sp. AM010]
MSRSRCWVAMLVLPLLLPGMGWAQESDTAAGGDSEETLILEPDADAPPESEDGEAEPESFAPASTPRRWKYLLRMEAMTLTLQPRHGVGEEEGFLQMEPTFVADGGPKLGFNLGAPVRLRLWGGAEGGGPVRKEDWDTLSDWGQVVRFFRLGNESSRVALWGGALDKYSLLSGHLVRHYSNRSNPDYHPAGVVLTGTAGPLYTEAFTSDILGARLMGAEVALDVQHVLFGRPRRPGHYALAVSAVHDWGRAGGTSKPVTLAHLDGTVVVVSRRDSLSGFEAQVFAGWGGRPGEGGAWGAVAGAGVDAVSPTLDLRARLEVRRQHGGFRQGYFGPDYELARFQAAGTAGQPLADVAFREGYSAYGELLLGWDAVGLGEVVQRHLLLTLGVEAFNWGRVDVDGRLGLQLFQRSLEVSVQGVAVGARQPGTRYLAAGEVRWRFLGGGLYALGQGGTLLYPTPEGPLRPGSFFSLGMGVDNAR